MEVRGSILCAQVCGVYGSWHLGKLQVGLSRAVRLAQCRTCRIVLSEALPVQVDGEPWHQPPATLDISFKGQVATSSIAPVPALLCPVCVLTARVACSCPPRATQVSSCQRSV